MWFAMLIFILPACQYEDSTNCYWDAQSRGNGIGTSLVNLEGTIHYVPQR